MTIDQGVGRRRFLEAAGVGVAGGLAGCARSGAVAEPSDELAFRSDAACADDFEISEEAAQIELGSRPTVRLRLRNAGESPIGYDITVIFEQGTSLGIPARTGRAELSGALGPGEAIVEAASDDASDVENTESYKLNVSLDCRTG